MSIRVRQLICGVRAYVENQGIFMTKPETKIPIAEEIVAHYNSYDESQRLTDGFGNLERERTQELIKRYLPTTSATIMDIGGAGGVYSFWLAGLGYNVHW